MERVYQENVPFLTCLPTICSIHGMPDIYLYGLFIICHAEAIFGWEMLKFIMIEKTVGKKWGSPSGIFSMEQETCGFY